MRLIVFKNEYFRNDLIVVIIWQGKKLKEGFDFSVTFGVLDTKHSGSNLDNSGELPTSGYGTNAWPDLALSSSAKIDHGSLGTEVSNNLSELSKLSSSRGGKIANLLE